MTSDCAVSQVLGWFDRAQRSIKPAKPFVVGPESLTYGTLIDRTRRLSALFGEPGLGRDDHAVIATYDGIAAVSGGRVSEDRQERPLELDVGCLNRFEVTEPNP